MNKSVVYLAIVIFNIISFDSFAGEGVLNALSKNELKKYKSLPLPIQSDALRRLEKIGNYDPSRMFLDNTGHFFVVDDSLDKLMKENVIDVPSDTSSMKQVISDNPPSGYTPEGIPIFHSFPGSPNVIYLNFLGGTITNKAWNQYYGVSSYIASPYVPAAYNPSKVPGFPPAVKNAIASIWARVAEDYAPWQIDVTTESPATYTPQTLTALITRSTTLDGKSMPSSTAGGIGFLAIFNFYDTQYYSPALIYYDNLVGGNEDAVAAAVSHEIGHGFGLSHEGTLSGSPYYLGAGSGEISWGCLMGAPYFKTVTKFCSGDYQDANNKEDQVAIITSNLELRTPSAGNSPTTATPLTKINGTFRFSGIIENYTTSDFFSLNNVGGTITVNATTFRSKVGTLGNNLCLSLRLLDNAGNVITSSSNPQTCSATLTATSLPLGTYLIQVFPVGNPITPFSVYGSMGQYDLTGTFSSIGSIIIKPPYSTLALNSTMSFDAYDTVNVSNGVPPYTYKATLNSFTRNGNSFIYTGAKPGLDTITVTDSVGNTASASVTVSLIDFGGMYGGSKVGNYNNPITGTFGCPAGYISQPVMGVTGIDYPLYYCYRVHANGVPANFDFGGIYSGSSSGVRPNPVTGAGSCPSGYTSAQVFGESTNNPDYPVYFCYKTHSESVAEAVSFAAMYSPATCYNNPISGGLSCPAGTIGTLMLGTPNVDYPFYFCTYPRIP